MLQKLQGVTGDVVSLSRLGALEPEPVGIQMNERLVMTDSFGGRERDCRTEDCFLLLSALAAELLLDERLDGVSFHRREWNMN